jgi:SAM-dependent methyltransferase
MNERIARWDERFARGELSGDAPSEPLPTAVAGLHPGTALDLACGAGRHALWLAARGWRVHAIDGSGVALERVREEARLRGIPDRVTTAMADLEEPGFTLGPETYDLVCDFYFLHRPLFESVRRAVRPGGLFVAAIHVEGGEPGRFLLKPGELRALVEGWGWRALSYREGPPRESEHRHPTAELIAQRPL